MYEWAETGLQYGLGPLVAAGALLWQQRRTDRRDERNQLRMASERQTDRQVAAEARAADRAHERSLSEAEGQRRLQEQAATLDHDRAMRALERQSELATSWRDERRQVYTDLLALLDEIGRRLVTALYRDTKDGQFKPGSTVEKAISWDAQKELSRQVARIHLVGSKAAGSAASSLVKHAVEASNHADYARRGVYPETWTREKALQEESAFERDRSAFLAAVRTDLGTDT